MTFAPSSPPPAPIPLETLTVRGAPRELGRGVGEAFRERVRAFVAMRYDAARGYFAERAASAGAAYGLDALLAAGAAGARAFAEWDPEGFAEHVGIAEAAGLEPEALYTATMMTDLRDAVLLAAPRGAPIERTAATDAEGCTSVLVPPPFTRAGEPLAGQTWDLNPPDVEYVVAVRREPHDGPGTWSLTCVGCLTLVGMNEHGLAVGTTNVKTYGSRPRVAYLAILHRMIRERDVAGAARVVETAPHAGAHTYWMADAERLLELEASPNGVFPRAAVDAPVVRTNHCLAPEHVALEGEPPSPSSHARLARASALVGLGEVDEDALRALFSDRSDGVLSINRYPEDAQGTATNGVFIAAPRRRTAWACRGPGDRGVWVELGFA